MAPDLLSTIRREIDERLSELRPLLAEHEQLLVAANALEVTAHEGGADAVPESVVAPASRSTRRTGGRTARRGSADRVIARVVAGADGAATGQRVDRRSAKPLTAADARLPSASSAPEKSKPARAARGAAREAILAALDHGSHTLGELAVVTAMSGPNINGNLRRLLSEGAVTKTEREGKSAWALAGGDA